MTRPAARPCEVGYAPASERRIFPKYSAGGRWADGAPQNAGLVVWLRLTGHAAQYRIVRRMLAGWGGLTMAIERVAKAGFSPHIVNGMARWKLISLNGLRMRIRYRMS